MMLQKKVCLLGSVAVGKTSLVRRFVEGIFSEHYLTTIGVKIDRKRMEVGGNELSLILWDLAGEDEFARLEGTYLRGASGYVLVVDGTRPETLQHAIRLQARAEGIIGTVPFVVAVNKIDLRDQYSLEERELEGMMKRRWDVRRTSAKTSMGVEALFALLGERILNYQHEPSADPSP